MCLTRKIAFFVTILFLSLCFSCFKFSEDEEFVFVKGDENIASFYISKTEVTQALFERVTKTNPSVVVDPNFPVQCVTWWEAIDFCLKLSKLTKLEPYYEMTDIVYDLSNVDQGADGKMHIVKAKVSVIEGSTGYRLLTDEEWQYAANGGKPLDESGYGEFLYAGSDKIDEVAWYRENSDDKPHAVATKQPNSLGIFDMSGNVAEHVYTASQSTPEQNLRYTYGGSFFDWPDYCELWSNTIAHDDTGEGVGIRIARSVK